MIHIQKFQTHLLPICILLFLVIAPNAISAASLKLVPTQTTPNLHLSLKVDKIEKLAGLKISLTYPDKILKFNSASKTKATSSFMHVVNDKNPGKLIIVMASAKGISGSDVGLFSLDFAIAPNSSASSVSIHMTTCQLMTENLKELSCNTTPFTQLLR